MDALDKKTCTKCGKKKYMIEYHHSKNYLDGFKPTCIECVRAYRKEHERKNFPPKSKDYSYPYY